MYWIKVYTKFLFDQRIEIHTVSRLLLSANHLRVLEVDM